MSDPLRSPDGRFRAPTATERFARQAPAQGGETGDLDWLDRALAKSRRRAAAVYGPATDPALSPAAESPEPSSPPQPSAASAMIPAGPRGGPPTGDPIRDALRRYRR
jgi:hypothetical protein